MEFSVKWKREACLLTGTWSEHQAAKAAAGCLEAGTRRPREPHALRRGGSQARGVRPPRSSARSPRGALRVERRFWRLPPAGPEAPGGQGKGWSPAHRAGANVWPQQVSRCGAAARLGSAPWQGRKLIQVLSSCLPKLTHYFLLNYFSHSALSYCKPRCRFNPWVRKIPWRREWQPTLVFFAWKFPRTEEPGGLQSMGSQRDRTQPLGTHSLY